MDQSTFCGYRFCGLHYVKSISLAFSENSILHGISDACVYFRSFRVYMFFRHSITLKGVHYIRNKYAKF